MAESLTAAMNDALATEVRRFARQRAFIEHFTQFPADQPALDDVVLRRVSGTDHPARRHGDLVRCLAQRYVDRHPDWAASGRIDAAVDHILELVELLDGVEPTGEVAS